MVRINLNAFLRCGWCVKHPNEVQSVDKLTLVKQCVNPFVVIFDGTEFLNA